MKARGIIDVHVHGSGRHGTRRGAPADISGLARLMHAAGVEAFLPALYPAPPDEMRRVMALVRGFMDAQAGGKVADSARVLGVHLEGPFLNPAMCGALDKRHFMAPSIASLNRLLDGMEDVVRIVTLAPELGGAPRVIGRLASRGIAVSMGHSAATYKQALRGKEAGATGVTHLFNAMRGIHHREPGLAGFALYDPDVYVEVIADGVHVAPEVLSMVFKIKPDERIIVVSDSVTGPMKKGGVLQGGRLSPLSAAELLGSLGVGTRAVKMAMRTNPLRYLSM